MIDNTDRLILKELVKNSRITMKELGDRVHLTGQAVANRVMKLEETGIIDRYTINLSREKLGVNIHVMITVTSTTMDNHNLFLRFINAQEKYIFHNYKNGGDGCYIIEEVFPSNEILDNFLNELNKYVNYKVNIIFKDTIKDPGCFFFFFSSQIFSI